MSDIANRIAQRLAGSGDHLSPESVVEQNDWYDEYEWEDTDQEVYAIVDHCGHCDWWFHLRELQDCDDDGCHGLICADCKKEKVL